MERKRLIRRRKKGEELRKNKKSKNKMDLIRMGLIRFQAYWATEKVIEIVLGSRSKAKAQLLLTSILLWETMGTLKVSKWWLWRIVELILLMPSWLKLKSIWSRGRVRSKTKHRLSHKDQKWMKSKINSNKWNPMIWLSTSKCLNKKDRSWMSFWTNKQPFIRRNWKNTTRNKT